jgi:hypothetical protein
LQSLPELGGESGARREDSMLGAVTDSPDSQSEKCGETIT